MFRLKMITHYQSYCCFPMALRPNAGHSFLILEDSRSYTTTQHSREGSSGRVISLSQRPLPNNTHNRQTSLPSGGFELTVRAGELPQTYALDRAAARTGIRPNYKGVIMRDFITIFQVTIKIYL
jgi:hypothetical protein